MAARLSGRGGTGGPGAAVVEGATSALGGEEALDLGDRRADAVEVLAAAARAEDAEAAGHHRAALLQLAPRVRHHDVRARELGVDLLHLDHPLHELVVPRHSVRVVVCVVFFVSRRRRFEDTDINKSRQ